MSPHTVLTFLTIGLLGGAALHAESADAPPVNVNQLLRDLHTMSDKQAAQSKTSRLSAYQEISAAASNPSKAIALWEEAVRATQMEGVAKENTQFRAWQNGEGEYFKEQEVQNALHLHLEWLALTLQRSAGTPLKDMLNALTAYGRELTADIAWMEAYEDAIKKDEKTAGAAKTRMTKVKDAEAIKREHDAILNRPLGSSIVVQWLKLTDAVNLDKWEQNPGSLDGIYKTVIQPELRTEKDQRVFEYWDYKLKQGADAATKTKLAFEVDKFNSQKRPELLWSRAQEYVAIGQKNRGMTEMFNLIKSYPTHPAVQEWITALEAVASPPAAATAATTSAAPPTPTPTPPAPVAPTPPPLPGATDSAALPGAVDSSSLLPGAQ